jgi:hypothetical protein
MLDRFSPGTAIREDQEVLRYGNLLEVVILNLAWTMFNVVHGGMAPVVALI